MISFEDKLKMKMHEYVKNTYKLTRDFPKDELYGVVSQLRRSTLSVILNYIEGYARFKNGSKLQFYEMSFGSLKESRYLIYFSYTENYISKEDYDKCIFLSEEISKMLWRMMAPLREKSNI